MRPKIDLPTPGSSPSDNTEPCSIPVRFVESATPFYQAQHNRAHRLLLSRPAQLTNDETLFNYELRTMDGRNLKPV